MVRHRSMHARSAEADMSVRIYITEARVEHSSDLVKMISLKFGARWFVHPNFVPVGTLAMISTSTGSYFPNQ